MPFDSSGNYTLPGGNPVVPETVISSSWANNTLSDIANALSSTLLRRAGSVAPMNLNSDAEGFRNKIGVEGVIQNLTARIAALESNSTASIGTIIMSGTTDQSKFGAFYLVCDGREVSRTTYSALFAVIGTTWGIGNGGTTFNLPDFRGVVPRGLDSGKGYDPNRTFASYQADDIGSHGHSGSAASSGGHTHTFDGTFTTGTESNNHFHAFSGVTDMQGLHNHGAGISIKDDMVAIYGKYDNTGRYGTQSASGNQVGQPLTSTDGAHSHNFTGNTFGIDRNHTHSVTINGTTGGTGSHTHTISIGNTGGPETRMKNVATVFLIRYA